MLSMQQILTRGLDTWFMLSSRWAHRVFHCLGVSGKPLPHPFGRAYNAGMALLEQLEGYEPADSTEAAHKARILELVARSSRPFDRRRPGAHLTASALVLDAAAEVVLLLRHRKLGRWVQPGGHWNPGETHGEEVALREAREETGLPDLRLHPTAPRPIHVDILEVPAFGDEPGHQHLDLRYLVMAPTPTPPPRPNREARALGWFGWSELPGLGLDGGLELALEKARSHVSTARGL
jgi:8-oxo-dGTP pyrophosphatase MutT (NUDIX family)